MIDLICYKCGEEMHPVNDIQENGQKVIHSEHILHNALFGKLKSDRILCKTCGSGFGEKEDADFVKQFDLFTLRLSGFAIPRDHGRAGGKTLSGYILSEGEITAEVNVKDGVAAPLKPFYKYDEEHNKIIIYAQNSKVCNDYQKAALKNLEGKGIDVDNVNVTHVTDMLCEGDDLGYKFSLDNPSFKRGMNKIALGFALHSGVPRAEIPEVLDIDGYGVGQFQEKPNLIPFFPIGALDSIYEASRHHLEPFYPTHTLVLFNQKNGEENHLFCYIELFSTFQFYVLLNRNYSGRIYEVFHQTVMRHGKPDIEFKQMKPKHLHAFMSSHRINPANAVGDSLSDIYEYAEKEYKKINYSAQVCLDENLENIFTKIRLSYFAGQSGAIEKDSRLSCLTDNILGFDEKDVVTEFADYFHTDEAFNAMPFRQTFHEGGVVKSTPWECMAKLAGDSARMKDYGHMKFYRLVEFINGLSDGRSDR